MRTRFSSSVLAIACVSALSGSVLHADPVSVVGKVDAVTVYRGQAMVTRSIDLPGKDGLVELIVTDLPQRIVPGSLFAEAADGIQVRSVLYRTRAVAQDVREEVRKIDDQLKSLSLEATAVQRQIGVLKQNADYVTKMENFVTTTGQAELSKGVLNAETLTKLTTDIFARREQISKDQLAAEVKLAGINEQIELTQRQRAEITRGAADTAREAVVLLDAKQAGKTLKLNYLVDGANWSPSYTINASAGQANVTVLYQAAISQMSGEEWGDVQMRLSTATPSVISLAPTLTPMTLTLRREQGQQQGQNEQVDAKGYVDQLKQKRELTLRNYNSNNHDQGGKQALRSQSGDNWYNVQADINPGNTMALNGVAQEQQMAEFILRDKDAVKELNRGEETITVTYDLPGRTTLQSRADQQLVGISTVAMKSEFYKVAVPVLTPYVYNEASVTNDSKTVLLAGPCVAYMNGQFVGHGQVPTTFVGGSFTAGFGIDTSLRASRELIERTEVTQGGNQVITFDYRLSVENFSDQPATIRLLDRMPKPDGNQLKPTLISSSVEPSKDAEYARTQKKQGILRFDIEVPKGATNGEARTIDYRMTIEHDKQMTIAGAQ